jgi:hypothetical protein
MSQNNKEINPFRTGLKIHISEMLPKSTTAHHLVEVENAKPVSVYMDNDLLKVMAGLSASGKDMLLYIMRYLGSNRDTIELKEDIYIERMNVSDRTFRRAKEELTNLIIVKKKSRKDVYYINPQYLFRGNRINAYPESIVVTYTYPDVTLMRSINRLPKRNEQSSLIEEPEDNQ